MTEWSTNGLLTVCGHEWSQVGAPTVSCAASNTASTKLRFCRIYQSNNITIYTDPGESYPVENPHYSILRCDSKGLLHCVQSELVGSLFQK